jgi:hypothetical protein
MSRFQALTSSVLDDELEALRRAMGLESSQKAELLREVAALASWVVRQVTRGRQVEGRKGQEVEALVHPALERIRSQLPVSPGARIELGAAEVKRLAAVLERGYRPTPALRRALTNLASPKRRPPVLRWKARAS